MAWAHSVDSCSCSGFWVILKQTCQTFPNRVTNNPPVIQPVGLSIHLSLLLLCAAPHTTSPHFVQRSIQNHRGHHILRQRWRRPFPPHPSAQKHHLNVNISRQDLEQKGVKHLRQSQLTTLSPSLSPPTVPLSWLCLVKCAAVFSSQPR